MVDAASRTFHRLDCPVVPTIPHERRRHIETIDCALRARYEPCSVCNQVQLVPMLNDETGKPFSITVINPRWD